MNQINCGRALQDIFKPLICLLVKRSQAREVRHLFDDVMVRDSIHCPLNLQCSTAGGMFGNGGRFGECGTNGGNVLLESFCGRNKYGALKMMIWEKRRAVD